MILKLPADREEKLRELQRNMAKRVIIHDEFPKPVRTIAGFDLAFSDDKAFVTGVVLEYGSLLVKEIRTMESRLSFPYVPTLLAFREGPPIIRVYRKFKSKPDIILVNGHGIAHPFFCGIASHLGVVLDKPSVGVAQRKLCGSHEEVARVGDDSPLIYKGRIVGYAYKSREGCKPIFVSPGHRVSLESSLRIVKGCIKNHKLPEPIRLAHSISNRIKINTEAV